MGLPLLNNPAVQGNLFIHFEIEFPKELNSEQSKLVMELLSAQKPKAITNT
jgi:DnaJ-class molecular chaperone